MIELPESNNLSFQITDVLVGKKIENIIVSQHPHKFAFFSEYLDNYYDMLKDQTIVSAKGIGAFVEIKTEKPVITLQDGVNLRFFAPTEKIPTKHQLLIEFYDGSILTFSVQMYGGIYVYPENVIDNKYFSIALSKPSPISDEFDRKYFDSILNETKPALSAKAFLATEQRIPGLGNGVLQDILFDSNIHPKTKLKSLSDDDMENIYQSVKKILHHMTVDGGRDTEKDIYGVNGNYKTKLSKNSFKAPCVICGGEIIKEAYLGGSIYYCINCQPLK